ncbi:uncharacterized protein LOC116164871 [Photinus pyralis]|uniref:uncharacterized protein LOC116164871 n=1 Tax=Photinus pyralis TaxID=7054 RepID=UPI00126731AF|nr:uncharacterized protein LOC116164871 [Photinus pyralis]
MLVDMLFVRCLCMDICRFIHQWVVTLMRGITPCAVFPHFPLHNDPSLLLNVAQQFVSYNVESVELLADDTEVSGETAQRESELDGEPDEKKMWTDENITLLIRLYQTHENEFNSGVKKNIWNKISKTLCEATGMTITGIQCYTKWKGLIRHYKIVKKHNKTSGNDHKYWKFYALINDILHKKPEITPVAVCSSSCGLQENESSDSSRSSTPTMNNTPTRRLRKKAIENAIDKRHRENAKTR